MCSCKSSLYENIFYTILCFKALIYQDQVFDLSHSRRQHELTLNASHIFSSPPDSSLPHWTLLWTCGIKSTHTHAWPCFIFMCLFMFMLISRLCILTPVPRTSNTSAWVLLTRLDQRVKRWYQHNITKFILNAVIKKKNVNIPFQNSSTCMLRGVLYPVT